jgi:hypothetical protein
MDYCSNLIRWSMLVGELGPCGATAARSNPVKTTTTIARRRSFVATAILSLVAASAVVAGSASPAVADIKPTCAGAKEQVVDVTRSIRNVPDFGVDGHIWALDSFEDRLRIWRVGTDRYCVRRDLEGTFETFAGPSPNLTGTVDQGITGTFTGTIMFTNTAEFLPQVPVSGYLGEVDAGCSQDGSCTTTVPSVVALYFPNGPRTFRFFWREAVFDGGSHGTFIQNADGNFGDITS